jgi:hypothetical protein
VHNGKGETRRHDEGKKQSMISLKLEMTEGLKTKSCCQYLEPRLLATQIYSNKMQQIIKSKQPTNVYFLKIIGTS